MKISLLCPTRERVSMASRLRETALSLARNPDDVEVLFYVANDDPTRQEYVNTTGLSITVGYDQPTSRSWNVLAERAGGDLLFMLADDARFETQDWDVRCLDGLRRYPDGYVCVMTNDGRGGGTPHPAVGRQWFESLGYLAAPMMHHFGVDTWITDMAARVGRQFMVKDVMLRHQKVQDPTRKRVRELGVHERDLRYKELFLRWRKRDAELLRELMTTKPG
jgi:hypothetical protein